MSAAPTQPPAVAISGSPRSRSRSKLLAELTLEALAERGYETRLIDLATLPADALLARGESPEVDEAIKVVGRARIVIAATPKSRTAWPPVSSPTLETRMYLPASRSTVRLFDCAGLISLISSIGSSSGASSSSAPSD